MQRPIFFTGTGTDIGKTHVLCEILKANRKAGKKARVLKPVISGFDSHTIGTSDTVRLLKANGFEITSDHVKATTPWRFKAPLSPDMAARRENRKLRLQDIVDWCFDQTQTGIPTIIEGAGGVMSPIAEDGLNLNLITELDAHPVLIAGNYLGTISHTLTALRVMDRRCTVLINEIEPGPVPAEETRIALQRFAPRADIRVFDPNQTHQYLDILYQDN